MSLNVCLNTDNRSISSVGPDSIKCNGGIGRNLDSVESRPLFLVIGLEEDISEILHPDSKCVLLGIEGHTQGCVTMRQYRLHA